MMRYRIVHKPTTFRCYATEGQAFAALRADGYSSEYAVIECTHVETPRANDFVIVYEDTGNVAFSGARYTLADANAVIERSILPLMAMRIVPANDAP